MLLRQSLCGRNHRFVATTAAAATTPSARLLGSISVPVSRVSAEQPRLQRRSLSSTASPVTAGPPASSRPAHCHTIRGTRASNSPEGLVRPTLASRLQSTMATTGVTAEGITAKLQAALAADHVQVVDTSGGCGQSFSALIVSSAFQGKTLLARHRLVNAALKDEIAQIHAWTPRCLTPEQWEKEGRAEI